MAKEKQITIADLQFDDKNPNRHTQKGLRLLEKSLQRLGAGRSIVLDKNNRIICGNGVVEVAGQIGLEKVRVVETTGDEIVAVKRVDLSLDSAKARELALADNQTAKVGIDLDLEVIQEISEEIDLNLLEEYEIIDKQGSLAKNFNDDTVEYDKGLPYPITIIVTEDDYNYWVQLKRSLGIENDRDAFLTIIANTSKLKA